MKGERVPARTVQVGDAVHSPHTGQLYLVVKVERTEDGLINITFGRRGKDPSLGLIRKPEAPVTVRRKKQP